MTHNFILINRPLCIKCQIISDSCNCIKPLNVATNIFHCKNCNLTGWKIGIDTELASYILCLNGNMIFYNYISCEEYILKTILE